MALTRLQRLEAESIHIMREVAAECANPVMLYSTAQESSVLRRLATKAFFPAPPPFPILHVDTVREFEKQGFDAAIEGARREEQNRAREGVFSLHRPELWSLYNARKSKDESVRVFPLSNWTELDLGQYINPENIDRPESLLRFIVCGSVHTGTSTLIAWLRNEPAMDGIEPDSIDVAYRFFSTSKRSFIAADAPGHEQYMRNVAAAATTADVAVILVDAGKGVLTQIRRHSYLVSLLGIRQVVLAVNKMDLAGFSQQTFHDIENSYRQFAARIGIENIQAIPLSAASGDNIIEPGENMPWYSGPSLLRFLETVQVEDDAASRPFRMPVQWVNRTEREFLGYAGTVASGTVRPGDHICVLPSGQESAVAGVVTSDGDLDYAVAGQSVTLTFTEEIGIARGDVLAAVSARPQVADQFEATLVWLHDEPLLPGRAYVMKIGARTVMATVGPLKYRMNVDSLEHTAAERLELNDIGVVEIQLDHPVPFEPYKSSHDLGGFILIDRLSNNTIGGGLLHFSLRRADNIQWQALDISKEVRARQKRQQPCLLWFTGLSGAGKSTIANLVEKRLTSMDLHTYLLDGDNVRHGLNKDLGFTPQDRVENIRRVAEVAKLMVDAGLVVLASFISPFRAERQMVRDLFEPQEFLEVFIDTPLEEAERRDPKGLYRKARRGELKNFTGIDSPYERPEEPEIRLDTTKMTPHEAANEIIEQMLSRGILKRTGIMTTD